MQRFHLKRQEDQLDDSQKKLKEEHNYIKEQIGRQIVKGLKLNYQNLGPHQIKNLTNKIINVYLHKNN